MNGGKEMVRGMGAVGAAVEVLEKRVVTEISVVVGGRAGTRQSA